MTLRSTPYSAALMVEPAIEPATQSAVEVIASMRALRVRCDEARADGARVGVVPTMGFLHEGHRSLMRAARAACDLVVVTIFVNPLQFGPNEDLDRYPRDLDADLVACASEGVDLVFAPSVSELYPTYPPITSVRVASMTDSLCGASRPGHFDGVTTVVAKLFGIIGPAHAYFGRKDAQQLAIIQRMTEDLQLPVAVVGCPLVREADGLAKSSRNAYLSEDERADAPGIFSALREGASAVVGGMRRADDLVTLVSEHLAGIANVRIDYVEVVNARTMRAVAALDGDVVLAVAVFCGATRLIDNLAISIDGPAVRIDYGDGWVAPTL